MTPASSGRRSRYNFEVLAKFTLNKISHDTKRINDIIYLSKVPIDIAVVDPSIYINSRHNVNMYICLQLLFIL